MRTDRVEVAAGRVRLRSPHRADADAWVRLRSAAEKVLRPVEPTVVGDWQQLHSKHQFRKNLRRWKAEERSGSAINAVIELDGRLVGMLTLGAIQPFPVASCWVGYWVGAEFENGGVATAAVALACDFIAEQGVRRVEATVLADNLASIRVLEKCGFHKEGVARELFHMDGAWRDHYVYARLAHDSALREAQLRGYLQPEAAPRYSRDEL